MKKYLLLVGLILTTAVGYAKYTDLGGSGGGSSASGGVTQITAGSGISVDQQTGNVTITNTAAGVTGSLKVSTGSGPGTPYTTISSFTVISPAGGPRAHVQGSSLTIDLSTITDIVATSTNVVSGGRFLLQPTTIQTILQSPNLRLISMNAYDFPLILGNNAAGTTTGIGFQNGAVSTSAFIGWVSNTSVMTIGTRGKNLITIDGGSQGGVSIGSNPVATGVLSVSTGAGYTGRLFDVSTGAFSLFRVEGGSIVASVPIISFAGVAYPTSTVGGGGAGGSGANFDLFIATLPTNAVRVGSMTSVGTVTSTTGFVGGGSTFTAITVGDGSGQSSLRGIGGPLNILGDMTFQTTWYTSVSFPFDSGVSSRIVSGSLYGQNGRFLGDGQQSSGPAVCGYFQISVPQNYVTGSTPTLTGLVELSTGLVSQTTQWLIDYATTSIVSVSTGLAYTTPPTIVSMAGTGTIIGSGGSRENTTDQTIPGLWSILGSGEKLLIVRVRRDGFATVDAAQSDTAIGNIGFAFRVNQ